MDREGDGTPLQYSCLENPMDQGAWQATVHGVAKSQTRLSDSTHTHTHSTWKEVIMVGTVFLCFYFSVLMTVAVMGYIESWLNPHNVYSSFLRVFILQDSLMGLAFMVMHVCAHHLSIFYLQGSLGAYMCILPPRNTPSLKLQP